MGFDHQIRSPHCKQFLSLVIKQNLHLRYAFNQIISLGREIERVSVNWNYNQSVVFSSHDKYTLSESLWMLCYYWMKRHLDGLINYCRISCWDYQTILSISDNKFWKYGEPFVRPWFFHYMRLHFSNEPTWANSSIAHGQISLFANVLMI